jgi:CMP-N,N'-diacetyllegionaminic acid synthase
MKKLCIIPARGGSKRLPNKNILLLNNKPLVCHTIDAAFKSNIFNKIILSSDSENILEVVSDYLNSNNIDIVTLNKRPDYLASDTSKTIDTVEYYYNKYDNEQVWLLQPTSPLRNEKDIIEADKLLTKDFDGVVSITEMEFPPSLALNKDDNDIITAYDQSDPLVKGNSGSQDHPVVYRPNGAIYAQWSDKFKYNKNFYKGKIKGYFMDRAKSIDIDTKFDFQLAKHMIEYGNLY